MVSVKISDKNLHSKVALLGTRFDNAGLRFVGIQQGRAREQGVFQGHLHTGYRAAANERGCHGSMRFVANSL